MALPAPRGHPGLLLWEGQPQDTCQPFLRSHRDHPEPRVHARRAPSGRHVSYRNSLTGYESISPASHRAAGGSLPHMRTRGISRKISGEWPSQQTVSQGWAGQLVEMERQPELSCPSLPSPRPEGPYVLKRQVHLRAFLPALASQLRIHWALGLIFSSQYLSRVYFWVVWLTLSFQPGRPTTFTVGYQRGPRVKKQELTCHRVHLLYTPGLAVGKC